MNPEILTQIRQIVPDNCIMQQEPMKKHTTFKAGGNAALFITVPDEDTLKTLLQLLRRNKIEYFLLGNGSNLLVSDAGYDGVILKLGGDFSKVEVTDTRICAGAAALLSKVAAAALEASLTGFEFAAGIPGSVGGAMVMNAGAYGGEMKQVVEAVTVMDNEGEIITLDNRNMQFDYRDSILKRKNYIVLHTLFSLSKGEANQIKEKMNDLAARRREKQPVEYPSAGSTFKRPEGYFAGKLIMDAGLRGFRRGGAQVSEKHCGFVINAGDATATDIWTLMQEVQRQVKEQFDVTLEPEVIRLGKF